MTERDLNVERARLASGVTLVAVENAAHPSVCVRLAALGGPAAEPYECAGVAELMTRNLLLRSQRFEPRMLDDFLDRHGITLARGIDRHACEIVVRCPSESLAPALEMLAELVQRPLFVDHDVELMARQVERMIALQGLDGRGAAATRFRELAYPQRHPYARQPHGLASTVRGIRASALEQFHRTCVQPNRTCISVAGDFCFDELLGHAVRLFGAWTGDGSDTRCDSSLDALRPPRPAAAEEHIAVDSGGQAELIVGGPALGRGEPGYRALQLGTLILGQLGLNGRLGARLREQEGLAYECYAALEDVPVAALWTARAGVRSAELDRATSAILDEVRRLRANPVTAEELETSQTACLGRFTLALETNASLAGLLQSVAVSGSAVDNAVSPDRFADEIRQVTREHIQAAAQTWLDEEHLLLVSAGP